MSYRARRSGEARNLGAATVEVALLSIEQGLGAYTTSASLPTPTR
jgi:hypothetical protein